MNGLPKISLPAKKLFNIVSQTNKKHLIIAAIIGITLLSSGVSVLDSHASKNETKEIAVAPTAKPIPTLTLTPTESPTSVPVYYPTYTPTPYPQISSVPQEADDENDIPTPTPRPDYQPQNVDCNTNGNFTYCNNGTSSEQIGNTTYVHGGANGNSGTCTTNGDFTNCSDGSSSEQIGNESYVHGQDGSETCSHIGDMTECN